MVTDSAPSSGEKRNVSVQLEDRSTVHYTLCGLADEQIGSWAEFCASCFSYKANPPPVSYFERHYYNDPTHESLLVRVAIDSDTMQIVSSVRVFLRQVSCRDSSFCEAGGIGEVCTSPNHRLRGLSKMLIEDAIDIMTRRKLKLSLLHAAPAFFPVYQKVGYTSVTSPWSVVSVDLSKCMNVDAFCTTRVRLAEFPTDTPRLQQLHRLYSESRFNGCIVRTTQYWNEYISRELEGSLLVVVRDSVIVAWMVIRVKGGHHVVTEFGCDPKVISTFHAISMLLKNTVEDSKQVVELRLPTLVLNEMRQDKPEPSFVDWETEKADIDDGWMYKTLQENDASSIKDMMATRPHLIWPADSF